MQVKWEGVMPAVTTKFDENDALDLKMFEVNINNLLAEVNPSTKLSRLS